MRDGGLVICCFASGTHTHAHTQTHQSIDKRAIDLTRVTRGIHMMHTSPKRDLDLIIIIIYPWKRAAAKNEWIIKSGYWE